MTVEKNVRGVRRHFPYWKGERKLNKRLAMVYKSELIERYTVAGVNGILSSLNCCFDYLGRNDYKVKVIRKQRE